MKTNQPDPGQGPKDLWSQLTPEQWQQIELDVIRRIRALRQVVTDIDMFNNNLEKIRATKHAVAQLLVILAMFVDRIKITEDCIALDFNPDDEGSKRVAFRTLEL